jgi:hypothetical protein
MWEATWDARLEQPTEQFCLFLRSEPIARAVLATSDDIARRTCTTEHTAAFLLFSELALAQAGEGYVYPTGRAAWHAAVDRCDGELVAAVRTVVSTDLVPALCHPAVTAYLALRQGEAPSRMRSSRNRHSRISRDLKGLRRMDMEAHRLFAKALGGRVAEIRAARLAALAANNPEPALALARPAELRTCRGCGLCFPSRRKLFRHLESSTACVD